MAMMCRQADELRQHEHAASAVVHLCKKLADSMDMMCRRPMDFENMNVLHQLRCGGVLEAVRISCAGFPTKIPFIDFVDHFWNLVPDLLSQPDIEDGDLARAIVRKAGLKQWQAGTTKVSHSALSKPSRIGNQHVQVTWPPNTILSTSGKWMGPWQGRLKFSWQHVPM